MKKTVLKIFSVVLSSVLLSSVLAPAFTASAAGTYTPVVYVQGQGCSLSTNLGTSSQREIYPLKYGDSYIEKKVYEIMPLFTAALLTDSWDSYCDALVDAVEPVFKEIVLSNNGVPKDNSGTEWTWSLSSLRNTASGGVYGLRDYNFLYDWRLDPCQIATNLHAYIQDVLTVTGASKVNLVGRCLGANIVTAYLQRYGNTQVKSVILYCGTMAGTSLCGQLFCGNVEIDPQAVSRYTDDFIDGSQLTDILQTVFSVAAKLNMLNSVSTMFDSVYEKVYKKLIPRLLLATYATMPGYWSMIPTKDFENAKSFIFGTNTARYAGLIEKINNYHYNVLSKTDSILANLRAAGTDISVVCKYGIQLSPIVPASNLQADGSVETAASSLGATCANAGYTLGRSYKQKVACPCGLSHVSGDLVVDASTCLFPEKTWIIKGIAHRNFPACIDNLMIEIFNSDGKMTVHSNSAYPQFMQYNATYDTLSSLGTQQNPTTTAPTSPPVTNGNNNPTVPPSPNTNNSGLTPHQQSFLISACTSYMKVIFFFNCVLNNVNSYIKWIQRR